MAGKKDKRKNPKPLIEDTTSQEGEVLKRDAHVAGTMMAAWPPEVAITSPRDGQVYDAEGVLTYVDVNANATGREGDIVHIEWMLDGVIEEAQNVGPTRNWNGSRSFSIRNHTTPETIAHTITVVARDSQGYRGDASITVSIKVEEKTPPTYEIITPREGARFSSKDGNSKITVSGTAGDPSGVAKVEWSLDGVNFQLASSANNWTNWTVELNLSGFRSHPITMRFTDTKGNWTTAVRSVEIVPQQLAAHWKFDEGSGTVTADATGKGNMADLQGPSWSSGRFGSALSFDGVDDYVQVKTPSNLVMTTAVTICAWIKPLGPGTPVIGGVIVNKEYEYQVARWADGSIQWAFANENNAWGWVNTGYLAPPNQWTHIAVVYDNGTVKTYVNGSKLEKEFTVGKGVIGNVPPGISDMRIGGRQWGPQHFQGLIDEVRIYNYALTAKEIAEIAPPPNQLVAHWKFDEGSGTTAADATGNGNTGDVIGPQWTKSRFGSALNFDGVDDYVQIKTPSNFVMKQAMSFCAWIYPQGPGTINAGGIIVNREYEYQVARFPDGSIQWCFASSDGKTFSWNNTKYIAPLNQWTHVAVTYDNGIVKTYANGREVHAQAGSGEIGRYHPGTLNDIRIGGRFFGPQNFHGLIDEVRVYNYALPAAEIAQLIPPLPALLARWTFDEVIEGTVEDVTGNGNMGEVKGALLASGRMGKALSFDGDDYVEVKHSPLLEIGKDNSDFSVTFHMLLRGGGMGQWRTLMHKGEMQFDWSFGLWLERNDNRIDFRVNKEGGLSQAEIKLDTWTAVALVKAGDKIRLYIDGVQDQEIPLTVKSTSKPGSLYIGKDPWNQGLNGCLDEVRIYSYALTAGQVKALAQPPTLVAHWKLDEGKGTTIEDAALNGHDGKLTGSTWAWIPALYERGLSFGGNDQIKIENTPLLQVGKDDGDFSLSFHLFLRQGATGNWRNLMHKGMQDQDRTFSVWLHPSDNRVAYGISTEKNPTTGNVSQTQIVLNTWTAIAFIKAGRHLQLYLNGNLDSEILLPDPSKSNEGPLYIGKDPWYSGLNGCLDDMRLYNYALSVAEVAKLAQPPKFTPEAFYRLAAYHALLNQIGTSYEEIRLARGADKDFRTKLADKLGIDSDHLDEMFLLPEPQQITEKKLEEVFGLRDTTDNPLQPMKPPRLLDWRLMHLQRLWLEQDWPTDPFREGLLPIIDPDVIGPDDLRKPMAGNAPFNLWKIRREWVDTRLQEFADIKKQAENKPVAHWRFDEGRGDTAADATGNGHDGKLEGPAWTSGKFCCALSFDEDDRVVIENSPQLEVGKDGADFSVAFHLLLRQGSLKEKLQTIMHKGAKEEDGTFALWLDPRDDNDKDKNDRLRYRIRTEFQGNIEGRSIALLALNAWTAVAYVKAGNLLQLFINGKLDSKITLESATVSNTEKLYLGKDELHQSFDGCLDDVRIYDYALAEAEVKELAANMVTYEAQPDLAAMFSRMYKKVKYAETEAEVWKNTLPEDFDKLREALQASDLEVRNEALKRIKEDLRLSVESFTRLLAIRDKDLATSDPRNEKVSAEEWREVHAILTQAQKAAVFSKWREEEKAPSRQAGFGPKAFWISLREPKEGDWPPVLTQGHPLIDPDLLKRDDLPESRVSSEAKALWEARRSRLAQITKDLRQKREAEGFEAMLKLALGDPNPGDDLPYDLTVLQDGLNSSEAQTVACASKKITRDLYLKVEAFNRLMLIRAKDAQADPFKKPTAAEYAEVYAMLTPARKVKHEYPVWIAEEQSKSLQYWNCRKASLPRWCASVEARQQWLQALRLRSRAPIIDPDVIGKDDLSNATAGNAAFDIWRERVYWVNDKFDALQQQREEQGTAPDGFEKIVADTLDISLAELQKLADRSKQGEDLTTALEQLQLSKEAFRFLVRMRALLEREGVPLTEAEWNEIYNLLVQVKKRREFSAWQEVERQRLLSLSPAHFKLSEEEKQLPRWRATVQARQDWEDTLQARIDQERTVENGLRAAVEAVEEKTLPLLRDALVQRISALQGKHEIAAGDWLSEQLAIEVRCGSSQKTTRMLQAIASTQGVLFALRTGRLVDNHPVDSWKLTETETNKEGHFDEEWKWMGTYEAWASATLAYFYPEHLLIPTLRRDQTTAFTGPFLKEVKNKALLTPADARTAAADFANAVMAQAPQAVKDKPHLFKTEQLSLSDLAERRNAITAAYAALRITDPHLLPSVLQELFYCVPLYLALQLQKAGQYVAALDWFQTVFAYNLADNPATAVDERKIYYELALERNDPLGIIAHGPHWMKGELDPHGIAVARPNPYTRYTILALVRCFLEFGDSEFTLDTFESLARARSLYENARRLLLLPDLQLPPPDPLSDVIPPNPVLEMLRLRAELQLAKLRDGRNIAGMKRQVDLLTSISGLTYLPTIGSNGQLIIPGLRSGLRPTPYRFAVMLERSKQLVNIAQQIEAAYLAALEKKDAENYNLLKAGHDLQLAQAQEELQSKRIQEATLGVNLAQTQRQRAVFVKDKYTEMSSLPLNQYEEQMIQNYQEAITLILRSGVASALAATLQGKAALANSAAQAASAFMTIAAGFSRTDIPNVFAIPLYNMAGSFGMESGKAASQAAIFSAQAQIAQTNASIAGIKASHEWRKKEWELQAAIAEQDIAIGSAQVQVAQAQVEVVQQEHRIAQMQIAQTQAALTFLASKFTNAELYEWMSGILVDVYRYFLQQATAMAQLAENQLWFERQETPPRLIQANYWKAPSEGDLTNTAPDRRGLTGSARLLQDIYQLDQYAFKTDKRKLNLSQTFSLARLSPFEFEQLRETGVLTFNTPMSIFDREFPGHYLRLIKRVRVAVVALVPPHHGIRATLTASGISRVVIGGDVFQEVVIRRDPELIAFTSPVSGTGVFEMDPQAEMLLPFESMGVDTFWQFEMPKAANQFDFRTIADVLVTIEYTALHSFDYRQIVLAKLPDKLSGERSFSFRGNFSDAWYDLHNPEQSATPMKVKFRIDREDFPPNLDGLKIEHVLLFFSRVDDERDENDPSEFEIEHLHLTPKGETRVGGKATTIDGVVSTRRGNVWTDIIGKSPAGEWELALQDPEGKIKGWFKDGKINDILLVITYGGRTPAWPGEGA